MAKYSIEDTTLENIAGGVRQIVSAGSITPAQMKTSLDTAKTITDEQANLISQIQSALEGKGVENPVTETWVFTMEDDSTVTKTVVVA